MYYYGKQYARNICGGILTLAEARDYGYAETGEVTSEAGYVTRKGNRENSVVYIAGKGKRAGQFYYLAPRFDTTRYCWRVYIARREGVNSEK